MAILYFLGIICHILPFTQNLSSYSQKHLPVGRNFSKVEYLDQPIGKKKNTYMMIIGIVITTVNNGCVLITLDFLLFDHAFFLLTNLFKQYACRFVIRGLRYKFFPVSPIVICCSLITFRSLFSLYCLIRPKLVTNL